MFQSSQPHLWHEEDELEEVPKKRRGFRGYLSIFLVIFCFCAVIFLSLGIFFAINHEPNDEFDRPADDTVSQVQDSSLFVQISLIPDKENDDASVYLTKESENLYSLAVLMRKREIMKLILKASHDKKELLSISSPSYLAAKWLVDDDGLELWPDDIVYPEKGIYKVGFEKIIQRYVLALLYYSLGLGYSSTFENNQDGVKGSFLSDADECDWMYIQCNEYGYVSTISINDGGFTGTIPAELSRFIFLQKLDLSNNNLYGSIPKSFGNLKLLYYLDLSNNQLTGNALPKDILKKGSSLEYIYLSNNELDGKIPKRIQKLKNLRYLWLDQNKIRGSISEKIFLLEKLESLVFHSNRISGTIPRQIGNLRSLIFVDFSDNRLYGTLTRGVFDSSSIQYLYLNNNQFIGDIPVGAGTNSSLRKLWLNENVFTGEVPQALERLGNLVELLLQDNRLEGEIPRKLCDKGLDILEADCSLCSSGCCTLCT